MQRAEYLARTILVVDDQPDNLIVLQQVLAEYLPGCSVITARSAGEVLGLAKHSALDAALLDVQMPGMDGIEMCRQLKAANPQVPVMLLTSHSTDAALRARGLDAGADDFICRPMDNLELVARVKVLLRVRQAEEGLRRINEHLEDLVQERTEELQAALAQHALAARHILAAQEEERARVARDLHDGLGQVLTAVHLELARLNKVAAGSSHEGDCDAATAMVERASGELRAICAGLRPPLLDDLGLEPAVRALVGDFEQRSGIEVECEVQLDAAGGGIAKEVALCAYRILQESLHNIERHAGAQRVQISLVAGDGLRVAVHDDGRGFESGRPSLAGGWGLVGMRERAHLVNGTIDIRSVPLRGTQVVFTAPLEG